MPLGAPVPLAAGLMGHSGCADGSRDQASGGLQSTSGYLVTCWMLGLRQITPARFFRDSFFTYATATCCAPSAPIWPVAYPTGVQGNVVSKGVNELIIPNYKQTWGKHPKDCRCDRGNAEAQLQEPGVSVRLTTALPPASTWTTRRPGGRRYLRLRRPSRPSDQGHA